MKQKQCFITVEQGHRISDCLHNRLARQAMQLRYTSYEMSVGLHLLPACIYIINKARVKVVFPKEYLNPEKYDPIEYQRLLKRPKLAPKYGWGEKEGERQLCLFE